jgi:glycerol-3-phosphate acyltransferase PlsY
MDANAISLTAQSADLALAGQNPLWRVALALAISYLLGAIPTGYLAGRLLKGVDIRQLGSGNVGATNVFRNLGAKAGVAVLLVDMAKGLLAVTLVPRLLSLAPNHWDTLACGLVAVLGHDYTCFLNFKGGKGVATSAGLLLGLEPAATVLALLVFAAVTLAGRMVSLGSLLAALSLPFFMFLFPTSGGEIGKHHLALYLGILLVALVWLKHIPNIRRILAGTEHRFGSRRGGEGGHG